MTTEIKVFERMYREVTDICKAASSRLSPITVVPDNSLFLCQHCVDGIIVINCNF